MELQTAVLSINGEEKKKVTLPSSIFSIKPNDSVLYQVIRMYNANKRQGTASTKGRSEVRGGGRKPFKQKHTGRARAGSIRSPIRRGGGVVFGPKPRDYSFKVPKKVKRLAIRSAFSLKREENALKVVENFDLDEPKTKKIFEIIGNWGLSKKKVLLLVEKYSLNVFLAARNLPLVKVSLAKDANAYDILNSEVLVLTEHSVEIVKEIFEVKSGKKELQREERVEKSEEGVSKE